VAKSKISSTVVNSGSAGACSTRRTDPKRQVAQPRRPTVFKCSCRKYAPKIALEYRLVGILLLMASRGYTLSKRSLLPWAWPARPGQRHMQWYSTILQWQLWCLCQKWRNLKDVGQKQKHTSKRATPPQRIFNILDSRAIETVTVRWLHQALFLP
jgi:hypothetical protein